MKFAEVKYQLMRLLFILLITSGFIKGQHAPKLTTYLIDSVIGRYSYERSDTSGSTQIKLILKKNYKFEKTETLNGRNFKGYFISTGSWEIKYDTVYLHTTKRVSSKKEFNTKDPIQLLFGDGTLVFKNKTLWNFSDSMKTLTWKYIKE